ncbi:MAG: Hsp70 family protein, partial [Chloroflexota bacterium]
MSAVIGIDLGTTYTAVAHVNEAGLPEIIPNTEGEKITPSVVLFERDSAIVGSIAKEALTTDPESV